MIETGGIKVRSVKTFLIATTAISGLSVAGPSFAQDAGASESGVTDVITVTTRRKEENLNETPLAISAFGERQFEDLNVGNLRDLGKFVPNLHIGNFGNGNLAHTSVFMRGIGQQDHIITVDSGIGIYLDGVYLGRQVGSNLNMSNIERVEVARGPQGTLYGRNNIGGAINFITKKPTGDDEVTVSLQGGTRERAKADFYAASSLSDTVAVSMTGQYNRRGGVGDFLNQPNTEVGVGQIREGSIRGALNWTPSDDLSLILTADLTDGAYGQAPAFFVTGDPAVGPNGFPRSAFADDPYDTASPADNVARQSALAYGFSATLEYDMNDVFATKFIGSYRSSEYTGGQDQQDNVGAVVFPEQGGADQFSVEAQLTGTFDSWDFVAGAYFFDEDGEILSSPFEIFPGSFTDSGIIDVRQQSQSYALFGSLSLQLTDRLELSGGLRHTWDEKNGAAGVTFFPPNVLTERREDWTALTWDASLLYNVTDSVNVYALASRGYQAGGFPARPFAGPDQFVSYDPQFANNYEAGVKGVFFDRMQTAANIFFTKYSDLQLQFNEFSPGGGFVTITENAGEAEAYGVEFEGDLSLSDNFSIQSSIGYIDVEYTRVDANVVGTAVGNRPQLTPSWTIVVSPEFVAPLGDGADLTFRATYNYRSDMSGEADNNPLAEIDSRSVVGFNIRYQPSDPTWNLVIYGDNIFDEEYVVTSGTFGNPFSLTILNNERSEFGARITKSF